MRDLFEDIERPRTLFRIVAFVMLLYNFLRLLSIFAAPYDIAGIVHGNIDTTFSGYMGAWQSYLSAETDSLQISAVIVKGSLFASACIAVGYMFFSFFLGTRRKIAKALILSWIGIEIAMDIMLAVSFKMLPTKISLIAAVFLILFLRSPRMSRELR